MESLILKEYRCDCGKLLLKGHMLHGGVEIKCRGCGKIIKIESLKGYLDMTRPATVIPC
jgi:phage FluMu protein Com